MKITIRAISCATMLLLLAGCKNRDKIKREFNKKETLSSKCITKETPESTVYKTKEAKKKAQYKAKKIVSTASYAVNNAKIGLENAASKAKTLAYIAKDKIEQVAKEAQNTYRKAHNKYLAQRNVKSAKSIHSIVAEDEKELHFEVQEKVNLQV